MIIDCLKKYTAKIPKYIWILIAIFAFECYVNIVSIYILGERHPLRIYIVLPFFVTFFLYIFFLYIFDCLFCIQYAQDPHPCFLLNNIDVPCLVVRCAY